MTAAIRRRPDVRAGPVVRLLIRSTRGVDDRGDRPRGTVGMTSRARGSGGRAVPLPELHDPVDRRPGVEHRDVDGDGGAQLLRRRHHREGVVGRRRRRRRLPPVGGPRPDRLGDVGPPAPGPGAGHDERPLGASSPRCWRSSWARAGPRRGSSPSSRCAPARSGRSASPRSRTRSPASFPASTSSRPSGCRTPSGTSVGSSDRRWPAWRSPSAASVPPCGATPSASSP